MSDESNDELGAAPDLPSVDDPPVVASSADASQPMTAEELLELIRRAPCPHFHTRGRKAPCIDGRGCDCWKSKAR